MNADALSRIPNEMPYCGYYTANCTPEELPCGGCKFCTRVHQQWSKFEEDVDDIVPLAVRRIPPVLQDVEGYFLDENRSSLVKLEEGNRSLSVNCPVQDDSENSSSSDNEEISIFQVVLPGDQQEDDSEGVALSSSYFSINLRAMQMNDPDIRDLIIWKEEKIEPTQKLLYLSSPSLLGE